MRHVLLDALKKRQIRAFLRSGSWFMLKKAANSSERESSLAQEERTETLPGWRD